MKALIDISTRKLELLKSNGNTREILELDIAFNKAYDDFLKENHVEFLQAIDHDRYKKELKLLKTIVTEIHSIESKSTKCDPTQRKNSVNSKKITDLYKNNMK